MSSDPSLLAFVHVEKAAGTTFIHILRNNYFLQYLDVRPFWNESERLFGARDFVVSRRVVPGLACIAGHSVKPYSDLENVVPNVRYITILRDPVKRYVSHYQYWVEQMGKRLSFEEFLGAEEVANFQTKKYSHDGDLDEAKEVLSGKMFLVGSVEEFDQFLVMLRRKLFPQKFNPYYLTKNLARNKVKTSDLFERYHDAIRENNKLDLDLYRFAKEELYARYVNEYGDTFNDDVAEFKRQNVLKGRTRLSQYLDYILRRIYLQPVTGAIRMMHGMPAKGAY